MFNRRDFMARASASLAVPTLRKAAARVPDASQPVPLDAVVLPGLDGTTYVARHWADRGQAIAHCKLCPKDECWVGHSGVCLVRLGGRVPEDEAMFRALDPRPGA